MISFGVCFAYTAPSRARAYCIGYFLLLCLGMLQPRWWWWCGWFHCDYGAFWKSNRALHLLGANNNFLYCDEKWKLTSAMQKLILPFHYTIPLLNRSNEEKKKHTASNNQISWVAWVVRCYQKRSRKKNCYWLLYNMQFEWCVFERRWNRCVRDFTFTKSVGVDFLTAPKFDANITRLPPHFTLYYRKIEILIARLFPLIIRDSMAADYELVTPTF